MPEAKKLEPKTGKKVRGRPFPKGVSGNPGGRPKMNPEVKEILKAAAPEAARLLVEMMYDDNPKIAMWAITDVLDRTQGKPIQAQDINMDLSGIVDVRTQIRGVLLEQEQKRMLIQAQQAEGDNNGRGGAEKTD